MKTKIIEFLKIILFITLAIISAMTASKTVEGVVLIENRILFREMITSLFVLIFFMLMSVFIDKVKTKDSILLKENMKFRSWIKGCMLGLLMMAVTTIILIFAGWLSIESIIDEPLKVIFPFITMLFAAFWEELVFRGYALNKLRKITGKHGAAIFIAMVFALLHLLSPLKSPSIVVSTFFSGLLLNYAFLNKRSLYYPIGIHFAWNSLNNFLYGKAFFEVEYIDKFMAGINNPEQGLVGIIVTGMAVLYVRLSNKNQ